MYTDSRAARLSRTSKPAAARQPRIEELNMTQTVNVDYEAIKQRQRTAWETGDYPRVGNTLQSIAERLVDAVEVHAGQRVLDVACGQGNAALAAARRFADATGVDYATNLLAQGSERAVAEHLAVTFTDGDA
jgi:cyclopropane fatty-acyl-phospholipid synthase-like methyltransferase